MVDSTIDKNTLTEPRRACVDLKAEGGKLGKPGGTCCRCELTVGFPAEPNRH